MRTAAGDGGSGACLPPRRSLPTLGSAYGSAFYTVGHAPGGEKGCSDRPWVRQPFVTVTLRALDSPRGPDILDGGLVSAFVSAFASVYVRRAASLEREVPMDVASRRSTSRTRSST